MTPISYLLQRGTAMVMAPLVVIHLVVVIIAVQDGLTAEEILSRTRGSEMWLGFYALFAVSAAIHAGIGVQAVLREWTPAPPFVALVFGHIFIVLLMVLSLRAVLGVYGI